MHLLLCLYCQNCPKSMHNLILGCLLDLCENPKTVAHVNAWRGKGDISAAHLFCNVWRSEETDMGVAREHTGAMLGKCGEQVHRRRGRQVWYARIPTPCS